MRQTINISILTTALLLGAMQGTSVFAANFSSSIIYEGGNPLKDPIAVPDTGASTSNLEPATIASVSIVGILACALVIRYLSRLFDKKVKFDQELIC